MRRKVTLKTLVGVLQNFHTAHCSVYTAFQSISTLLSKRCFSIHFDTAHYSVYIALQCTSTVHFTQCTVLFNASQLLTAQSSVITQQHRTVHSVLEQSALKCIHIPHCSVHCSALHRTLQYSVHCSTYGSVQQWNTPHNVAQHSAYWSSRVFYKSRLCTACSAVSKC